MKMLFATIILSLLLSKSNAQHCPLDGTTLIAVTFIDKDGNAIDRAKDTAYLSEVDNANAAQCTYVTENIQKLLMNATAFEAWCNKINNATYSRAITKRLQAIKMLNNSTYIITLNQAERTCMIKKDNNFDYKGRKFVISFFDGKKQLQFPVPETAIQSLCTNNNMTGFKPIEIKL